MIHSAVVYLSRPHNAEGMQKETSTLRPSVTRTNWYCRYVTCMNHAYLFMDVVRESELVPSDLERRDSSAGRGWTQLPLP